MESANNCIPIGNPFEIANGTEIDGFPVRFAVTVLISIRNNETGSARHFHQDPAGETSDNDVVADAHCRNRGKAYYGLGGRIRA